MRRGFTLIETVLYVAIFSLLIGGVLTAAFLLFQSSGKTQARAMLLQEEQFIMTTIERLIGEAATVSVPASGGSGGTLVLTTYGGITYTLSRSSSTVLLNGSALNNTNVTVAALTFSRTTGSPDGITADITMQTFAPSGQSIVFAASTTKYIRK